MRRLLGSGRFMFTGMVAMAAAMAWAGPASACDSTPSTTVSDTEWVADVDDWFIAVNWDNGVPTAYTNARMNNWGEANIEAYGATARNLELGTTSDGGGTVSLWTGGALTVYKSETNGVEGFGTVLQYGGAHYVCCGTLSHGDAATGFGTYYLADGVLSVWYTEYVGRAGMGSFYQAGGTHTVSCGGLVLALEAGSMGAYSQDAGSLGVAGCVVIGDGGSGAFSMSSGTFVIGGGLTLADELDSDGSFALFDGQVVVGGCENVADCGLGSFEQYGGTHEIGGSLSIANDAAAIGSFSLLDGVLMIDGSETIGLKGMGTFAQAGGIHEVDGTLKVGGEAGSFGMLAIDSGSLAAKQMEIGNAGEYGMMDISSDAAYIEVTGKLIFGEKAILTAAPGSAIYFTGSSVTNLSADEYNLAGLESVSLFIDAGEESEGCWMGERKRWHCGHRGWLGMWRWGWRCGQKNTDTSTKVEVAGNDLGADAAGFVDNFALDRLVIGDTDAVTVKLVDSVDNGNRGTSGEAEVLYVHDIVVTAGSTLNLQCVKVYYDGTLDNQGTILGDAPIAIP